MPELDPVTWSPSYDVAATVDHNTQQAVQSLSSPAEVEELDFVKINWSPAREVTSCEQSKVCVISFQVPCMIEL